jgi:Cd2+/Zn2+-exporting ATPase
MSDYKYIAGKGGKASCFVCKVPEHCIGNIKMFANIGSAAQHVLNEVERLEKGGKTVVLISEDNTIMGAISTADTIRQEARQAIAQINKLGIKTVMLTGDNANAARFIANQVNMHEIFAALLPDQKVEKLKELKRKGIIAMVGDGVNDSPALAAADIGIAMAAGGSDVAIETADVALMNDNLLNIPFAIELGAKTLQTIKINIAASIGIKVIFLTLAFLGTARLDQAIAADAGVAFLVILNSLNLFRFKRQ